VERKAWIIVDISSIEIGADDDNNVHGRRFDKRPQGSLSVGVDLP
jgi:hypothetical protein